MLSKHDLFAGAAEIDITPLVGIDLTGFIARQGPSTGIHDRLFARALALRVDNQTALLIVCDLVALDAHFVAAARTAIQEATGITEHNIMVACTHTHSGPATIFLQDCGEVDQIYLADLRMKLVAGSQEAVTTMRKVKIGAGKGRSTKGVLNRRQPGAPVDPELGVISFQDEAGKILAILVSYACHPVCLDHTNRLISADYPGYLARLLQEQSGAVVLFTNGASGDINPERMGQFAYAQDLGQALAAETLRVLETIDYRDQAVLSINHKTINLPFDPPPDSHQLRRFISEYRQALAQAEVDDSLVEARIKRAMVGWGEATLKSLIDGNLPKRIPAEIQVFCLDEYALVGIPGELFSEIGKRIKNSAAACQVFLAGYTNDDIGYIPTRQAYQTGGYEVHEAYKYYGYPAALAPEAGEMLYQAVVEMIETCSTGV